MKALVTGGAGYIGSTVSNYLLDRGHDVTIIDNLSTGSKKNIPKKCPLYVFCILGSVFCILCSACMTIHSKTLASCTQRIRRIPYGTYQKWSINWSIFKLPWTHLANTTRVLFEHVTLLYFSSPPAVPYFSPAHFWISPAL